MTPLEALAELRKMHEPYIPEVVLVSDDGDGWREPTIEDRAESLEWWCDGCNRPAEKCTVMFILNQVEDA